MNLKKAQSRNRRVYTLRACLSNFTIDTTEIYSTGIWLSAHAWKAYNPQRCAGRIPPSPPKKTPRCWGVLFLASRVSIEEMLLESTSSTNGYLELENFPFTEKLAGSSVLHAVYTYPDGYP